MATCRFPLLLLLLLSLLSSSNAHPSLLPTPAPWPLQFHSILYVNTSSGALQIIDLWYDWPNGRNFNIIQKQLGILLYDLEWNNGTSFFYDLQAKTCTTRSVGVGILRPNWLDGATHLGVEKIDGFNCNVWSKADFIKYWEDIESKRPVHWLFYTGMSVHVITFEVGATLEDAKWQAPVYCFTGTEAEYVGDFASLGRLKTKALSGSLRIMMNQNEASWKLQWRRWHDGLKNILSF